MARPSDPLLAWLRELLDKKEWNTARLADATKLPRQRIRKVLKGTEPMSVDELLQISEALEISPQDMGIAGVDEETAAAAMEEVETPDTEPTDPLVDPWGNQPEQLFKIAFALGCDFFFLVDVAQLTDSKVPQQVLDQYEGRELPIKLDAIYHQYNDPQYFEDGVSITLSFDALYDCTFPWTAVKQVVFFPAAPEPPAGDDASSDGDEPGQTPHLRLVT